MYIGKLTKLSNPIAYIYIGKLTKQQAAGKLTVERTASFES